MWGWCNVYIRLLDVIGIECFLYVCGEVYVGIHLRNRRHFPCLYRVTGTRGKVWGKRDIAWGHAIDNLHFGL